MNTDWSGWFSTLLRIRCACTSLSSLDVNSTGKAMRLSKRMTWDFRTSTRKGSERPRRVDCTPYAFFIALMSKESPQNRNRPKRKCRIFHYIIQIIFYEINGWILNWILVTSPFQFFVFCFFYIFFFVISEIQKESVINGVVSDFNTWLCGEKWMDGSNGVKTFWNFSAIFWPIIILTHMQYTSNLGENVMWYIDFFSYRCISNKMSFCINLLWFFFLCNWGD